MIRYAAVSFMLSNTVQHCILLFILFLTVGSKSILYWFEATILILTCLSQNYCPCHVELLLPPYHLICHYIWRLFYSHHHLQLRVRWRQRLAVLIPCCNITNLAPQRRTPVTEILSFLWVYVAIWWEACNLTVRMWCILSYGWPCCCPIFTRKLVLYTI